MPKTRDSELPRLITRQSKGREYAEVRLPQPDGSRKSIALGPAGPEANERYRRTLARWIEQGRSWAAPADARASGRALTLAGLGELYAQHARGYYIKHGRDGTSRPTQSVANIERVIELLKRAPRPDRQNRSIASLPAREFGPLALDAFRTWLAAHPDQRWSRRTINTYASWAVAMVRWGVSRQLVPAEQLTALEALPALRKGRRPAPGVKVPREGEAVPPATAEQITATAAHLTPTLARAVKLHALTGMRIGELLAMRLSDLRHPGGRCIEPAELLIDPPAALIYRVPSHADKTDHVESRPARNVAIGPVGRGLIWEQLAEARAVHLAADGDLPPDASVFDPRVAVLARHLARREASATAGRRVRRTPVRLEFSGDDTYTRAAYRRAIIRAAERAGVEAWSPHQLRHTAATEIANSESIHVAQAVLGHAAITTTRRYVGDDLSQLIDVADRRG